MITHVTVAVMYVANQDRSLDFYVGKLGFTKRLTRRCG
jgi:lactoylglutathione lyase